MIKHIIECSQFDREWMEKRVFPTADQFADGLNRGLHYAFMNRLSGKSLLCLFFEPSTRTIKSHERAGKLLGMSVDVTENASVFSSAAKGESLEDSIQVLARYHYDVIVLRHKEIGAAERAAQVIDAHGLHARIVNAGDGAGEHPTQALLDLYTIWRERKRKIDGIHVVFGGDLKHGRTVRSLARLLAKYKNVTMAFVAPDEVQVTPDILEYLRENGVEYSLTDNLHSTLPSADVFYQTRLQLERVGEDEGLRRKLQELQQHYRIGQTEVALMKPDALIMHPLPRVEEILFEIDGNSRSAYFRQAQNGLYVRMALLVDMFDK